MFQRLQRKKWRACLFQCLGVFLLVLGSVCVAEAAIYDEGIALPKTGTKDELAKFIESVYQKSLDYGIRNFLPYSLMLVKESQAAASRKDYETALLFADYACKFSPDIPAGYIARTSMQWHKNKANAGVLASYVDATLLKALSPINIEDLCALIFENAAALCGAMLLTLCAVAFLTLLKYLPLAHHDLRHVIPDTVPDFPVKIMIAIVLLLPLVCRLSLVWACAWWLVCLLGYCSARERYVVAGLLLLLAVAVPLLAGGMAFGKFMPQQDILRLLWKTNYGYWNTQDQQALVNQLEQRGADEDILLSLGLVNKREGSFSAASLYFEKALKASPGNYRAVINLGNVFFAENDWDAAIKKYEEAAKMNSLHSAAAHFNRSRVYQHKFMFDEAEKAIDAAKKLELSRVSLHLQDFSEHYNRVIIEETVPVERLWQRGFAMFMENPGNAQGAWNIMAGGIPLPYGPIVMIILLCGAVYVTTHDTVRIAVRCKLCGKTMCKRCQRSATADLICAQCSSFLRKQSTLGYGIKEEKRTRIRRYITMKRIISEVLGYALPGGSHFWAGRPVTGAASMYVFFLLALKALMPHVSEGPWDFLFGPRVLESAVYCVLLLLFWSIMAIVSRSIKTLGTEENLLLKIVSY